MLTYCRPALVSRQRGAWNFYAAL